MLDDLWFVAEGKSWSGPFTAEEMAARVHDGRFRDALVWKPQWQNWVPIGAHFAAPGALPVLVPATREQEDAPEPTAKGSLGVSFAIWGLTLLALALWWALFSDQNYYQFGRAAAFVYAGVWGAAVVSVVAVAGMIWRLPPALKSHWFWQAGKAVTALAVLGALAFSIAFVRTTGVIYNVSEARRNFENYQVIYDPVTRVISFEGPIGPGFADRLSGIISSNSGVKVLRIEDSPGGLIDEALAAARRIERTPGLVVEAMGECNSACFALFMAARERRAEFSAEFGFHQPGLVSDVPAFAQASASEGADLFREYVIQRGFPAARFDEWTRSEQLHAVSAIELSELRIVASLLDAGVQVEPAQARWLWIAMATEGEETGFAELARAFANSGEAAILQAGAPVFVAARGQDVTAARAGIRSLLPTVLPRVLESADPEQSMAYIRASTASIDYLVSMEQWTECGNVVDGRGVSENVLPNSIVRTELTALAAAVQSAARTAWVARPLPSWAEGAGRNVIAQTIEAEALKGVDNSRFEADARTRCLLTQEMLHRVGAGAPTRATVAYRWIMAH